MLDSGPEESMTVKYPFLGTHIDAPDCQWELEQQIHKLVTAGKPEEAIALFKQTDLKTLLTPEVIAEMKAIVEAQDIAARAKAEADSQT
jgi:hypothetical protein